MLYKLTISGFVNEGKICELQRNEKKILNIWKSFKYLLRYVIKQIVDRTVEAPDAFSYFPVYFIEISILGRAVGNLLLSNPFSSNLIVDSKVPINEIHMITLYLHLANIQLTLKRYSKESKEIGFIPLTQVQL